MSSESHTGFFLANEIEEIIKKIGPEKFSAIVTDAGANIQNACKIITDKYQHILNIRCIAYAINLIFKDIYISHWKCHKNSRQEFCNMLSIIKILCDITFKYIMHIYN